ncbi:MAG: putative manganese transporter [Elusimicrobiota bacterium]
MQILQKVLIDALKLTAIVFVTMLLVDYLSVMTRGKISEFVKKNPWMQYFVTSSLAVIPGCVGSFINVSLYIRGIITFGALTGSMLAASGDEAFIMLAMFPGKAVLLFAILFVLGIIFSFIIDKLVPLFKIRPCDTCELAEHVHEDAAMPLTPSEIVAELRHPSLIRITILLVLSFMLYNISRELFIAYVIDWEQAALLVLILFALYVSLTMPVHYLTEHIGKHLVKRHLWRIFVWTFGALVVVEFAMLYFDFTDITKNNMVFILLAAVLIGIIPESGPHILFVTLYAKGVIPFSVLLASSIVQDGHGMLPLLSHSVRDAAMVKGFNVVIGLTIGLILLLLGM